MILKLFTLTVVGIVGVVVYSRYRHCDPLATKRVKSPDQILPLFVMDTLGSIPGCPGLFVAGIFSGSLT
jgi:sodium-coupled monocarboxylate transporter 8/12